MRAVLRTFLADIWHISENVEIILLGLFVIFFFFLTGDVEILLLDLRQILVDPKKRHKKKSFGSRGKTTHHSVHRRLIAGFCGASLTTPLAHITGVAAAKFRSRFVGNIPTTLLH